jgi:hypothetical protein
MFIAVNDKRQPSPFGGAKDELPFTIQVRFRSSERRRRCLPFHSINISPRLGRRPKQYLLPSEERLPSFGSSSGRHQ